MWYIFKVMGVHDFWKSIESVAPINVLEPCKKKNSFFKSIDIFFWVIFWLKICGLKCKSCTRNNNGSLCTFFFTFLKEKYWCGIKYAYEKSPSPYELFWFELYNFSHLNFFYIDSRSKHAKVCKNIFVNKLNFQTNLFST